MMCTAPRRDGDVKSSGILRGMATWQEATVNPRGDIHHIEESSDDGRQR